MCARVLITGSSDGLGLGAGQVLARGGHRVTLHARNAQRAADTRRALPAAEAVLETVDGVEHVFAINVLAPYVLTVLIERPDRLVYLSSGMHRGGNPDLGDVQWRHRRWNGAQAYSDSKLFDTALAFAVARRWPDVRSNAVDPGWIATKMGGAGAPGDVETGARTQAWLAVSDDPAALVSGELFYHQRPTEAHPAAGRHDVQDELLAVCSDLSGLTFA